MKGFLIPILALLAASACETSGQFDAGRRADHAILIMAEDADPATVPADSRISRRVLDEFASQIAAYGFSVFDETALTFDTRLPGGARRSDAELIDIARAIRRPPIDSIALFTIQADRQDRPHTSKLRVRVSGRLLDARSGQRRGNFELSDTGNLRPDCIGPCFAETVGDIARVMGREVADVLASKLDVRFSARPAPRPEIATSGRDDGGLVRGMTLTFDDFSIVEMQDIERYLAIFSGYRSHRPVSSFHRHFEIWYESAIGDGRMRRNLDRMFEELGLQARISFAGGDYHIRQIRLPLRARRDAPGYRW